MKKSIGLRRLVRNHASALRRWTRRSAGLGVAAVLIFAPAASQAKEATIADAFRAANDLIAEVRLLHVANFSTPPHTKLQRGQVVQSRHVLQLARTVLRKVNMLAWISGGDTIPIGPMPTQKVRPSDVLEKLKSTDWVIKGLKPIFSVSTDITPAPLDAGKTPNDVYAALYQLSEMIDGLGIPKVVPNDIYQLADAIVFELEIIANHHGAPEPPAQPRDESKYLQDVYARAFVVADALRQLVEARPKLTLAGGIIRPSRQRGVMYALNDILADVVAMRATTGRLDQADPEAIVSGMTPSDVHQRLDVALAIIRTLLDKQV